MASFPSSINNFPSPLTAYSQIQYNPLFFANAVPLPFDPSPQRRRSFREDFDSPASASFVTSTVYEGSTGANWLATNINAATGLAVASANNATEIGVVTLGTGANTNGGSSLTTWSSTTAGLTIRHAAADAFYCGCKVATTTVSDGTDTFVVRAGLADLTNAAANNGLYFEWDANTDTHIKTKSATGGSVTAVQTTGVVAGTTYHVLELWKPFASSTVYYAIDGTLLASTATLPAANPTGPTLMVVKSAGTNSRSLSVDWFAYEYVWAANRG